MKLKWKKWKIQPIDIIGSSAITIMIITFICYLGFGIFCIYSTQSRNEKVDATIEQIKEADKVQRMYKNQTFLGLLQCLCIINQEGQKGWKNPEELEAAVHFYNHLISEGYDLKDIKIESPYVQKDTNSGKLKLNLPANNANNVNNIK